MGNTKNIIRPLDAARMLGAKPYTFYSWIRLGIVPGPTHPIPGLKGKGYTLAEVRAIRRKVSDRLPPKEIIVKRFEGEGSNARDQAIDAMERAAGFLRDARDEFPELSAEIELAGVKLMKGKRIGFELWVRI